MSKEEELKIEIAQSKKQDNVLNANHSVTLQVDFLGQELFQMENYHYIMKKTMIYM